MDVQEERGGQRKVVAAHPSSHVQPTDRSTLPPSSATDLVNGLHGKVERHKLADGLDAAHGCADGNARKARLGDGRVNHALP